MYLDKRESYNSFSIAPPLIIFLVILGAGALTCCGFAIYRFHSGAEADSAFKPRSEEQDAYMREVRERNWSHLPNYAKKDIYTPMDTRYGHAPMTPSAHSTTTWGG